jgi:hypothetical protein
MGASMGGWWTNYTTATPPGFLGEKKKKKGNIPNINTEINNIGKLFLYSQYSIYYCGNQ